MLKRLVSTAGSRPRSLLLLAAAVVLPLHALAQPHEVLLSGTAQTGSDTRAVRFHFYCSANNEPNLTGALSVELEIPQVEQLRSAFEFEPFEGPDAHAGALSHLDTAGSHSKAQAKFTASGYYPADPATSFILEISAARRPANNARLRAVAAVLRPLIDAPSKLVWQQGNANPKGVPLVASLQVEKADAELLSMLLSPCLAEK